MIPNWGVTTTTATDQLKAQDTLDRRGRTLIFRSPSTLAARVLDVFGLSDLIEPREGAQP